MDNGAMRKEGLLDKTNPPSKEEIDVIRAELLAGAADPNTPSWSVTVAGREIKPDALFNLNFGSDTNAPVAIEMKEKVTDKLRRFFKSIFN